MSHRHRTRRITLGGVPIGGGAPVSVQTMTSYPASRVEENLSQIREAASLGCEIVRVAVASEEDAKALSRLIKASALPIVADVHFDHRLAIKAAEVGAAGIRINPGNLGGRQKLAEVVRAAKANGCVLRIGVNAGSLRRSEVANFKTLPDAMVETAARWIGWLESLGFENFKVSLKSSHAQTTLEANRKYASRFEYPLHLGLTESGTPSFGAVLSSAVIGALLLDGIGDTIRISLTGGVREEVLTAHRLLVGLGLREGVRVIACPGCGRQHFDVATVAEQIESSLAAVRQSFTVAVMGCEVNGPGEAETADFGLVGTKSGVWLYVSGHKQGLVKSDLPSVLAENLVSVIKSKLDA